MVLFSCFFLLFSSSFIIVILNNCKVDYKVFVIRNNIETVYVLIYLSPMQSCLWGWSCYHYILVQRTISHRIHIFLVTLSMVQVRHLQTQLIHIQLRNRLRVHMVCEWAWVSIPGELDLPKSLNWCCQQASVNKKLYWLSPTLLHLTARPRSHDW